MPFPMKIQPIDAAGESAVRADQAKPVVKSRLKRLFERQFPGVLRVSSSEKLAGAADAKEKDREAAAAAGGDLEPSSLVLDKMVQSFIEDSNERPAAAKCGRNHHRCNCFHGNCSDSSDDEFDTATDAFVATPADVGDVIKGLVLCASVAERNLSADASAIMEKIKNPKGKEESRRILADGLRSLGYDAAVCKSRWDKTPSYPAGEHEYVDVIVDGGCRILVDVDFRSEFEIARSTKRYRALLQCLPLVFVGTAARAAQIVAVVSEAARQSLKKKGLHFPPWRKPEYMRAKWLAPYGREALAPAPAADESVEKEAENSGEAKWQPPAVRPKATVQDGAKAFVVTGLASVLLEKP